MNVNEHISTKKKKELLLIALEKSLGVITTAIKSVGINRGTYYLWINNDEEFKKAVDELPDIALDFAESKLHSLIQDKNPTAIIFFLKTKGKHRGYVEKQEIEHQGRQISVSFDNED
jgi:hypothetical protein